LFQGAIRETKEEAGIDIVLKGILKIEYCPHRLGGGRLHGFFYAEPKDPKQKPKAIPDYESRQAKWMTFDEITALYKAKDLRGNEAYQWPKYVEDKGTIYPLEVLDCFRMMM